MVPIRGRIFGEKFGKLTVPKNVPTMLTRDLVKQSEKCFLLL